MSNQKEKITNLRKALHAIVVDVEAMHEKGDRFGPFDVDTFVAGRAYIEWPNLRILLEEAKQILKGKS